MIPWQDESVPLDATDEPSAPLREEIDPVALGDLTDDMAINGLLQPIGVRGPSPAGRYETIWGHRRLLAARSLHWATIPARVCPWPTAPELARLAENMIRADLNPREEAKAIRALRGQGRAVSEIARILRRSVSWVDARIELLKWPEDLQQEVAHGTLSFRCAALLAEVDHDDYRKDLVDEARRTGATASVVGIWLAHYQADRDRILRNRDTVAEILTRRETFRIMFKCECCGAEKDTQESVLLRVCSACANTLEDEKRAAALTRPSA